jgi:hypothetical protein
MGEHIFKLYLAKGAVQSLNIEATTRAAAATRMETGPTALDIFIPAQQEVINQDWTPHPSTPIPSPPNLFIYYFIIYIITFLIIFCF